KMRLGFLRTANRKRHTMRTFEIPACGALLCAPRTDEHEELFVDGRDALFFDDRDELRFQVERSLNQDDIRRRTSESGRRVVADGYHTYSDRVLEMVRLAVGSKADS